MALILPTTELRDLPTAAAAPRVVRAAGDEGASADQFIGHAARFDDRTLIGRLPWGFYESIAPGSFTDTLADGGQTSGIDQAFLLDHDSLYVVARRAADNLRLAQDTVGLAVDADLDPDLFYVSGHLLPNLRNGNMRGMSFGFWVREDEWTTETIDSAAGPMDVDVRKITRVDLLEVSAVTFPAFPSTDAGLRDVAHALRRRDDHDAVARHVDAAGDHAPTLRALLERDAPTPRPVAAREASSLDALRRADALAARLRF